MNNKNNFVEKRMNNIKKELKNGNYQALLSYIKKIREEINQLKKKYEK